MINSYSYDIEVLPNFFSITIVDLSHYLEVFKDGCTINSKGKRTPIPLVQKYSVVEIKEMLESVRKWKFYITDTDDSQLIQMLGFINQLMPHYNADNKPVRSDMFGYNTTKYDKLMIAALLMFSGQTNTTKELITRLYETSKNIIEIQNNKELSRGDYFLNTLRKFSIPFVDVDVMTIFALNKVGKGIDSKTGEVVYFPKSLKQTSINLQWYELLEFELPPIREEDAHMYHSNPQLRGLTAYALNQLVDKWDMYIPKDQISPMMHYNVNDVYIVCEMVRLYIDEIRLRYNISKAYEVNVLSSSRSNIADVLFTKFYSEFSGLQPRQWQGNKTERTALGFKRVILPFIKFKTPVLINLLEEMKKTVIHSIGKDAFSKEIRLNKLDYTIATGGLHSIDKPRELRSKYKGKDGLPTKDEKDNILWDNLTDDSYVYVHWDIASFYPAIMAIYKVAPAHLNEGVFVKLVDWLRTMRIEAKNSKEEFIDGIPKDIFVEVLKIVINSIYGKLGYQYGDLFDKLAVLKTTINGQLLIMMLCEELEEDGIEVASANTDGIVIKLYKTHKDIFDKIADAWKVLTQLQADSEEYEAYVNRDINNYAVRETNGKMGYKGALNPLMYARDLSKGYDMPIVADAVVNYFFDNKPVLETLYEANNILDFCKTQNVGRQYHVEFTKGFSTEELQRNVRFYVSNRGGKIEKVSNSARTRSNLCAGQRVTVLNSLNDQRIEMRNINYSYYYEEAMKIINPIKLGISPNTKGDRDKGTKSGKALIKTYGGQFNTLFDDNED